MMPELFLLAVAAAVGLSPILILTLGYLLWRWITAPFRRYSIEEDH